MPSKTKIALVSSLLGSLASAAYSQDKINSLREAIGKIEPQLAKLNSDYWEQTDAHQKINHNVLVLKDYADRGIVLTPVEKNYISNFEPYLPEWKEHLDNQWRAIERLNDVYTSNNNSLGVHSDMFLGSILTGSIMGGLLLKSYLQAGGYTHIKRSMNKIRNKFASLFGSDNIKGFANFDRINGENYGEKV